MPPLGLLFGWLLLGEHVAPLDLIGSFRSLGIYLVTRPARATPNREVNKGGRHEFDQDYADRRPDRPH